MRVRSFEFENFGKHKKVAAALHGNVVGFKGSNFSGKSTIAKGIKYCLADELSVRREAANTFIRNWEEGVRCSTKAVLKLQVDSPQGDPIEITKIITSTGTERSLSIGNDSPITKAKAFSEAMSGIFGTDVSAIAKLAFSPQGALAEMINTLTSDREKLFMRVLDAEYIQSASKVVASRAATIKGQNVDYEPLIMETRQRYNDLKLELVDIEDKLSILKTDDNPMVLEKVLREVRQQTERLIRVEHELQEAQSTERRLSEALKGIPQRDDKLVESLEKEREGIANVLSNLSLVEKRNALKERLHNKEEALRQACYQQEEDPIGDLRKAHPLEDEIRSTGVSLALLMNEFAEGHAVDPSLVEIALMNRDMTIADREKAKTEVDLLKYAVSLGLQSKKLRETAHSAECCPVCKRNGKLPEWGTSDQEELEKNREDLRKAEDALDTLFKEELRSCSRYNSLSSWVDTLVKTLGEDLGWRIAGVPNRVERVGVYNSQIGKLEKDKVEQDKQTTRDYEEVKEIYDLLKSIPEVSIDGGVDKASLTSRVREINASLLDENSKHERRVKIEGSIETAKQNADRYKKELEEKGSSVQKALTLFGSTQDTIVMMHNEMVDKKNALSVQLETRESILSNMQKTTTSLEKYAKLADGQRAKRVFVSQLEDMAARLDRIPKVFVKRQFESLVTVVSSILAEMDTMYEVRADPRTPLSFIYRDFSPDSVWLPQTKLSGSQSVRLSLGFLIAVQRALLPHIGFMVLDEPSLHLDPEGKKQLADLFSRLGHTIFTGNSQLLIFDYDPTVLSRCEQIVDLDELN